MELNNDEKLKNCIYSPKEALAYFVVSSDLTGENIESLITALKETMAQNINNKNILEKLSLTSLEKITNYWSLTAQQVIAYGYVVFYNLIFEDKVFSEDKIDDMFVYVMKLYSPDDAVRQANIYNKI